MPSTMDFFGHQEEARRWTARLVVLYALAVLATMAGTYLVVVAFLAWQRDVPVELWNPKLLAYVGGGVAAVVAFGTASKFLEMRAGGAVVAEHLGGRLVSPATRDPVERKVLNVVEEMSIASGVPVPDVYLLDRETRINAFAAGHAPEEAVIGITRGAAELLTRDELQGVVAHEYSHVLNGDMRLNLRLLSVLHGILVIGLLGGMLLRASMHGGRSGRRGKGGGGAGAVAALGLALMVLGYLGTFFGKLIKAGVSRQREFLADASAVAFTRNPSGIAGALKKIGGSAGRAHIAHARAAEYSHMYFGQGIAAPLHLLATHPPLDDRIRRIEPRWNGLFPTVVPLDARVEPPRPVVERPETAGAALAGAVGQVGRPTPDHLAYAQALIDEVPERLLEAVRTTPGAEAFVYALFVRDGRDTHVPEEARDTTRELARLLDAGDEAVRLPLLDLALPALRRMDRASYRSFLAAVDALVLADQEVSPYEWALRRVLRSYLVPAFETVRRPVVQFYNLRGLRAATACLLSALARAGHADEAEVARAFEAGASALEVDRLELQAPEACGVDALDRAIDALGQAAAPAKRQLLEACARTIRSDRRVTAREGELLRAVADSLGCPMPPLLPGQPLA